MTSKQWRASSRLLDVSRSMSLRRSDGTWTRCRRGERTIEGRYRRLRCAMPLLQHFNSCLPRLVCGWQEMSVSFRCWDGRLLTQTLSPSTSFDEARALLALKWGLDLLDVRMHFWGRLMEGHRTLQEEGVQEGSTVELTPHLRGGMQVF